MAKGLAGIALLAVCLLYFTLWGPLIVVALIAGFGSMVAWILTGRWDFAPPRPLATDDGSDDEGDIQITVNIHIEAQPSAGDSKPTPPSE